LRRLGENLPHISSGGVRRRRAYLLNTFLSEHDTEIGNCPFDLSRRVTESDGRAAAWRRGLKLLIANARGGETKLSEIGYNGVKKKIKINTR